MAASEAATQRHPYAQCATPEDISCLQAGLDQHGNQLEASQLQPLYKNANDSTIAPIGRE